MTQRAAVGVSIVIPVLNDALALDALLVQLQAWRASTPHDAFTLNVSKGPADTRTPRIEIIVVDGGSRDDITALCAGRADHLLHSRPGRALQMNAGAQQAQGQALWFLHADTQLPPDALSHVVGALQTHPWGRFDVHIEGRSRWLPVVARLMNLRSRLTGIATGDQGLFMRTQTFRQLGGFTELPLMEDIDLSRRARALGRPACLRTRLTTSGRRWDTHGAWRTILLMSWLRLRFWLGADPHALHAAYYGRSPAPQQPAAAP